jgi:predicted deacylase
MSAQEHYLDDETRRKIDAEADRLGETPEVVLRRAWHVYEQTTPAGHPADITAQPGEYPREAMMRRLRAKGKLAEPTDEMRAQAASATMTLEDIQQMLAAARGPRLSELIDADRGPR